MNFQVYRTHASSYQDSKYLANEKKVLEEISDVNYIQTLQQYQPGSKIILITNTHTDPHLIPERILKETVLMIHPNSGYDNLSDEFRRSAEFPIIIGNPIRQMPWLSTPWVACLSTSHPFLIITIGKQTELIQES